MLTLSEFAEAVVAAAYRHITDVLAREQFLVEVGAELEAAGTELVIGSGEEPVTPVDAFWNAVTNQDDLLAEGEA